ncbi:MAG: carbohydrate ABC transporter substrate-binding protein [Thermomicrobiales bacterium]|jgi:glucose/mannose transport system substrate-binding protein|nr:carbohydrate ABC transporter substrate-binding protein [Thermomicrobiales bacterium]
MKARNRELSDLIAGIGSGRVTRRDALKRGAALGLSVPALSMAMKVGETAAQSGSLEIFSWWTSPGEAPALQSLFDSYAELYPDVEIVNAAIAGGGGGPAQAVLQTRLQGGNPPDSWQTHIGRELFDGYVNAGFTEAINDLYESEGWLEAFPPALVEGVTVDGNQYAVGVGVHRGNGYWYNREVLANAGVEVGETLSFDEFVAAADAVAATGVPAVALGSADGFVAAQYFENELISAVGPENYPKYFSGELAWDDDGAKAAASNFAKALEYVNQDHSALPWSDAVAMVIEGRAAFNSMGDWAYGEVVAKGAQDVVGWVSHPGTAGSFVLVVDCFTLPVGAPNAENAANWLKVIGSKAAQEAFNPLKGSIPARLDADLSGFSEYHQWSGASFANDALLHSAAHGQAASPAFKQALYDAALAFLVSKDVDTFAMTLVDAQSSEG